MIFLNIGSNLDSIKGDRFFNLKKTLELIKIERIKILKVPVFMKPPRIQIKEIQNFSI